MKLLLEDTIPLVFQIEEAQTKGNGRKKLRGLFQVAEKKNANKRVYSKSLLEREFNRILPAIKDRSILGEIGHPNIPQINLEKSSHIITDLKMESDNIFGELETLQTPAGDILEGLIRSGVKLGISSRGLGTLKEDDSGTFIVQEDYNLITWDIVPNPSTPEAWLGESTQPIIIPQVSEFIEFGGDPEKIDEIPKINVELVQKRISELFGGK